MTVIGIHSQEILESEYNSLKELQKKCMGSNWLKGKVADEEATFSLWTHDYRTEDGPAMLTFARYGNTYAIHTPQYLKGDQWLILDYFLSHLEEDDELIVFSIK